MTAPDPDLKRNRAISLEAVELELALALEDISINSFETCLSNAAAATGGSLLFHMPVEFIPGIQRVAAVLIGKGEDQSTVMVMLNDKGDDMRVEAAGEGNSFSGLAASFVDLASAG